MTARVKSSGGLQFERAVLLLAAEGLSDREIAKRLGIGSEAARAAVRRCQAQLNCSREAMALYVLKTRRVLTVAERERWRRRAVGRRQQLHDAQVINYTSAKLMQWLATPTYWFADVSLLSRLEKITVGQVEHELAQLVRVLGSQIAVQVTAYLAPIPRPLFWNETNIPKGT